MNTHRRALLMYARRIGFPEPVVFFDNGPSSREARPSLENLLQRVVLGQFGVVLIPGPFVFSIDDLAAHSVVEHLRRAGCRVMELPRPTRRIPRQRNPSRSA
ncbi:hypothetical protein [Streptomyces sp. C10-9-1]|uniref:hypothetical protein n=1 Tax=Streptomyces sp. C10-9-1 TaxID=1859285 RepID=UPI003D70CC95